MFVEMVFIQRLILYFGSPLYAASAVITALLIFSGLGSYHSNYFSLNKKRLLLIFTFIIAILFVYSFTLTTVLQQTVHVNLFLKVLIVLLIIAPLAFCMGIPFPAGLTHISKMTKELVPWAWGINGCVSVISTVLATMVAAEMGFTWVILFAALAYCLPLFVQATMEAGPESIAAIVTIQIGCSIQDNGVAGIVLTGLIPSIVVHLRNKV